MPKKSQKPKSKKPASGSRRSAAIEQRYERARRWATDGQVERARRLYKDLEKTISDTPFKALIRNDLAALAALDGDAEAARTGFQAALDLDGRCEVASANLSLLLEEPSGNATELPTAEPAGTYAETVEQAGRIKVAILSFLFNWPSTGGGIVHTVELAKFLTKAGYAVQHFYARYPPWQVGRVEGQLKIPSEALEFSESAWNIATIQERYRQRVEAFGPDYVIITDSWNIKPLLAGAVRGYPYILRFQAMECLCPLNNVRLLPQEGGGFRQCTVHQLASPDVCARCIRQRGQQSGGLHQAERALAGVGTPEYHDRLLRALREAEAVLVVNPLHEAMIGPYTDCVRVVTAGMDPARFPWPWPEESTKSPPGTPLTLFFAGLVEEWMKGFTVLHEACTRLRQRRQDFELVATGDPPGKVDDFTRFIGWQSQADLPRHLRAASIVLMPTIAQEALGRTAVEAMAVGRPVIASRLGGLPFTVVDGATGLLCEAGDAQDLARKIERLLDDAPLRERLGLAGRRRFEEHYSWDVIIERHYRPLLGCRVSAHGATGGQAGMGNGTDLEVKAPAEGSPAEAVPKLADAFPWPRKKPSVKVPRDNLGWLADGAQELLVRELSARTKLVVELGAWLGLSTRFIADHAPNARVVTIDHWQGNRQHQERADWKAMLPKLYPTFLALCWTYRDRITPLKMTTHEGLKTVASYGLSPELIYVDAEHSYEAVLSDLELAYQLFPKAVLVGDDYEDAGVQEAVTEFAHGHRFEVETVGRNWKAWKLVKR